MMDVRPARHPRVVADDTREPAEPSPRLLLDDLAAQLERFRLLPGGSTAEAERVLSGLSPASPRERVAAEELATRTILAHPHHFEDAHHLTVKALEVFDRHGWRAPAMPRRLGPLRGVAARPVELVARTIVRAYARDVTTQMRKLYERREAQCPFDDPARRPLARARISMTRLGPDFAGAGGGLPRFLVGGAVLSGAVSILKQLGDLSGGGALSLVVLGVIAFAVFAAASWAIVRGAAVAHRRTTLIMRAPLAALWETIGAAGHPPEDDSLTFATIGIALTAVAWFVTPAVVGLLFYYAH
jgi:hypothetical protein